MGWFQELITTRMINDEELLTGAFADLAAPVMGEKAAYRIVRGKAEHLRGAVGEILAFYKAETAPPPDIEDKPDMLDYMLRPSGLLKRRVELIGPWYQDSIGPLLAEKDGKAIALIPCGFSGYRYTDEDTGSKVRVTKSRAAGISRDAFCFYKPLPQRALGTADLIRYILKTLSPMDTLLFVFTQLVLTLFGMAIPAAANLIFTRVVVSGDKRLLLAVLGMLFGVSLSSFLVEGCKNLLLARIRVKIHLNLQAALMERVLSLPAPFFKNFSAGETAERLNGSASISAFFTDFVFGSLLVLAFSVGYFFQIFTYGPLLLLPALGAIVAAQIFSTAMALLKTRLMVQRLADTARTSGLVFQLISGIQKIRLVGAENRAFAQWARSYRPVAKNTFDPPFIFKSGEAIGGLISLAGILTIYFIVH
jgi:ABC-type bacteriocin/lantibiotic exporter with double-glycine peptidase domain